MYFHHLRYYMVFLTKQVMAKSRGQYGELSKCETKIRMEKLNVVTDAGNNDLLYFEIIILMMGGKT